MGLDFDLINGQTPLDEEEKEGLLIPTITTREELDEFEQQGIESAIRWTLNKKFKRSEVLTEDFVKLLHKKMFAEVWAWAGEFRKTNKNIGVDMYQVAIELRRLIDDCNYWIDHKTYSPDETAVRFKHRIVQIHCFSNGNGRHSRLMGDLIIEKIFNQPVFSWGSHEELVKNGKGREEYLAAIKAADANNIGALLEFARK
jgi:Fic-DOC domain mobile mystery protein B